MANQMCFPEKWEDFVDSYSFKDKEEIYTNGSELIPVFRVEQMIEHYFSKYSAAHAPRERTNNVS